MLILDDIVVKFCLINDNIEFYFEEVNFMIFMLYIFGVRVCCLLCILIIIVVCVIRNKFFFKIKIFKGF